MPATCESKSRFRPQGRRGGILPNKCARRHPTRSVPDRTKSRIPLLPLPSNWKRRAENETFAVLTYSVDGQEKWKVRQRRQDGEGWWRYYEKHVGGTLRLRARRFDLPPLGDAFAKIEKPRPIKDNPLRFDKRLYVRVHIEPRSPTLEHIVERVRTATGLDITISADLNTTIRTWAGFNPKRRMVCMAAAGIRDPADGERSLGEDRWWLSVGGHFKNRASAPVAKGVRRHLHQGGGPGSVPALAGCSLHRADCWPIDNGERDPEILSEVRR